MKRLIAMLMVLCMMVPASCGMASSLFTLPAASEAEEALSYSAAFGVMPASETSLADGSTKQVYTQVQDQDFLDFGTVLAERGYGAENQQMVEGVAQTTVFKGDIRFTVGYDQANHTLSVVYPQGLRIEQMKLANPFAEAERSGELIRVEMGETFTLPGLCSVTVKDFHLNDEIDAYYVGYKGRKDHEGTAYSWIDMEVENISNENQSSLMTLSVYLHYVDENGHYSFYTNPKTNGVPVDHRIITNHDGTNLKPLYSSTWAFGFKDVPEMVRTSTDGYLAITFSPWGSHSSDKQYIIYVREP